jgi:hypothetical protein
MPASNTEQADPLTFRKFMWLFSFWLCVWGASAFFLLKRYG